MLVCAVLTRLVAPAPASASRRVEWLRRHGGAFDTIFVGSSRTARQVVPGVFDAEMAALGTPTRSFNLGAPGMRAPEDGYVLERALSRREAPLRFAIVEANEVRLGIPSQDEGTTRAVYWHDVPRMRVLWNRVWAAELSAGDAPRSGRVVVRNLFEFADHLRHWFWNASRLGRGPELLQDALSLRQKRLANVLGPAGDGYSPGRVRRRLAGAELERYQRDLEAVRSGAHQVALADVESQREIRRKQALAARYGARLVLVAPPLVGIPFAPQPESGVLFLDFSDPRRYPELFTPEHRNDAGHVNALGAELYSRLLARELAAHLRERPPSD